MFFLIILAGRSRRFVELLIETVDSRTEAVSEMSLCIEAFWTIWVDLRERYRLDVGGTTQTHHRCFRPPPLMSSVSHRRGLSKRMQRELVRVRISRWRVWKLTWRHVCERPRSWDNLCIYLRRCRIECRQPSQS